MIMNRILERERQDTRAYNNAFDTYYDQNSARDFQQGSTQAYEQSMNNQNWNGYDYNQQPTQYDYRQNDYSYNQSYDPNYQDQQYYNYPQQNYYVSNSNGYVRSNPTRFQEPTTQPTREAKKKSKLNVKAKLLIGVYFFIVAVVAVLLLVNMATAGTGKVSASVDDNISYNAEAVEYAVDSQGNVVAMPPMENVTNYTIQTNANWFDTMCDKISKIFG